MKIISENNIFELKTCNSFQNKLLGFMFKKKKLNYGLLFSNCSLHTFFCFQPLDIIYIDKEYNIIYYYQNVKQNKILFKKRNVKYIIEFSSNILNPNDIKIIN